MIDAASFNMGSGSYSHDLSVSENRILPASLRLTSMLLQELLPDSFRFWGSRMFVLFNSTIWWRCSPYVKALKHLGLKSKLL